MANREPAEPAETAPKNRDPLLLAMWNRLPEDGAELPATERELWLAAMEAVLALVYAEREDGG